MSAEDFDRLRTDGLYAAQALIENNIAEAARYVRRANWRWQRLPADEQSSYVNTTLFDMNDGPLTGLDDSAEVAFAVWFAYRCGLSMAAVRRDSEAANEAYASKQAADRLEDERRAAARDSTQAPLFIGGEVAAPKGRLQS